jgi:beta-alanine degradation protein BauB
MSAPQRKLGPIADRIVFENERVRIWELRMEPGHQGPVHRHDLDHILVQIEGDRMAVLPEPDTQGPYREYLEADVVPGQHFYVTRGGVEIARNVGRRTYHEIIIELKD